MNYHADCHGLLLTLQGQVRCPARRTGPPRPPCIRPARCGAEPAAGAQEVSDQLERFNEKCINRYDVPQVARAREQKIVTII